MQFLNDPYPWMEGIDRDMSMVDLVANATIPVGPAAMLWWALERGASLLTAGGPSGAGKSTLANACLHFLPDGANLYTVAGREDPLLIPMDGGPTYLLISELSRHGRPYYIAGLPAQRAFAFLRRDFRLVGTLHADSVDEAIDNLRDDIELSPEDIARVQLVAISRAAVGIVRGGRVQRGDLSVRRRIVEIGLLAPDPVVGVRGVELATWQARSGTLEIAEPPAGVAALAQWAGVPAPSAVREIAERAEVLARLTAEGRRDQKDVDDAVRLLRR
jgi:energy-coupling factor transporter ATP-binding protein EcfA2